MKGGVEAGDLRERRIPPAQRLDQLDLGRQMFRIIGAEPAQFIHDVRSEALRLAITMASMHHAMSNGHKVCDIELLPQPCDERIDTILVMCGLDRPALAGSASHIREGQRSLRKPDSIDQAGHNTSERRTNLEERTLEAR